MTDAQANNPEPTAVDDVRRVREKIACQHNGDLRSHMEETVRIFEKLRAGLKLKVVPPPSTDPRTHDT